MATTTATHENEGKRGGGTGQEGGGPVHCAKIGREGGAKVALQREERKGVTKGATGRRGRGRMEGRWARREGRGRDRDRTDKRGKCVAVKKEAKELRHPISPFCTCRAANCVCAVADGWSCT